MAHKHKQPETPESEEEHKPVEDAEEPEESSSESEAETIEQKPQSAKHKDLWHWLVSHKMISIPAAIVVVLGVVMAVPFTRYSVLGLFLKQDVSVLVLDSQTGKPVSSATVSLKGKTASTNGEGQAKFNVPVGEAKLSVTKQYYKTAAREVIVPVKESKTPFEVKLEATGRQVPVVVLNSISSRPVAGVTISAEASQSKTDDKGQTVLVVPAGSQEIKGTLSADGFNKTDITIKVTTQEDKANNFKLTPSGKIYMLSNQSGKIDLVKSNLDGSDRKVVLAGTGKENRSGTVLLASRDWKHVALVSKREGGEFAKLFVVDTSNDKVTTADEGEATFSLYGWSGDRLVYSVERQKVDPWKPKREALKSYHAPSKKITTLAETKASGNQYDYNAETLSHVYVLDQDVVYTRNLNCCSNDYQATLNRVRSDGTQKKVIQTYPDQYIDLRTAEFGELYIRFEKDEKPKHDAYEDGRLTSVQLDSNEFYEGDYTNYLVSPSGKKTFWSDYRDGKNVFFVGNADGAEGEQVGAAEDFNAYGWFTDDYLLLTKKGNEMRIMSAAVQETDVEKILKVGSYYTPGYYRDGFGYGYGR
jgi:hypothetical protein